MAKQFRIKRGHHHRRSIHHSAQFTQLFDARLHVALGVGGRCALSGCWVVGELRLQWAIATADAPQLEAQGAAAGDAGGLQFALFEIPTNVAMELPVAGIARVAITG